VPGAPSKADAGRLPDAGAALDRLNAAAARVPAVHRLAWPADAPPAAEYRAPSGHAPADRLAAALARAGIAFLTGPDLAKLRACPAPRCVRYFVQAHARQEWCKPSCGNRARVARHHARRRALAADDPS
jgi:predicted RNA-binding Zn ribbon-like protein